MRASRLTYRELNARANQLARYLQSMAWVRRARVGIWMERSLDMMVGLAGDAQGGRGVCAAGPELSAGAPGLHAGGCAGAGAADGREVH